MLLTQELLCFNYFSLIADKSSLTLCYLTHKHHHGSLAILNSQVIVILFQKLRDSFTLSRAPVKVPSFAYDLAIFGPIQFGQFCIFGLTGRGCSAQESLGSQSETHLKLSVYLYIRLYF